MIYQVEGKTAAELFRNWNETMIWSCLQGVMGELYADSGEYPESGMAVLGDFCFFAGKPNRELVAYKSKHYKKDFIIMTANTPEWFSLIESVYHNKAKKTIRYATAKDTVFDDKKLMDLAKIKREDIILQHLTPEWFAECKQQDWSRDFVALYADYNEYQRLGAVGVLALHNGVPVSGASAYSAFQNGIEIEIGTRKEYRRQGLATACGAKLILECLNRGWYPSWDAANPASLALAEKLGYRLEHEYVAYQIYGY